MREGQREKNERIKIKRNKQNKTRSQTLSAKSEIGTAKEVNTHTHKNKTLMTAFIVIFIC